MSTRVDAAWMVRLCKAQLDEMAGVCNQLCRAGRDQSPRVPILHAMKELAHKRPVSRIAIFELPAKDTE